MPGRQRFRVQGDLRWQGVPPHCQGQPGLRVQAHLRLTHPHLPRPAGGGECTWGLGGGEGTKEVWPACRQRARTHTHIHACTHTVGCASSGHDGLVSARITPRVGKVSMPAYGGVMLHTGSLTILGRRGRGCHNAHAHVGCVTPRQPVSAPTPCALSLICMLQCIWVHANSRCTERHDPLRH